MTTTTNITKKVQELSALEKELKAAQTALKAAQTASLKTAKTTFGKALQEAQEAEIKKAEEKVETAQAAYDAAYDAVYDDVHEVMRKETMQARFSTAVKAVIDRKMKETEMSANNQMRKALRPTKTVLPVRYVVEGTGSNRAKRRANKKQLRAERHLRKVTFASTLVSRAFDIASEIKVSEGWETQAEADWQKAAVHKMALVAADRAEASVEPIDLTGYDLVDDPWYVEKQQGDELESFGYTPHVHLFSKGDNFARVPVEACDVYRKQEGNEDNIFFVFNKEKYVNYIEGKIYEFAQRICKYESNNYFGGTTGTDCEGIGIVETFGDCAV